MKKTIHFLLIIIAIFAITGCSDFFEDDEQGNFWAQNIVTGKFYRVDAEKLAGNSKCEVWAEKGSGVTSAMANNVASEYSNNIYKKMIDNFGWTTTESSKTMNTMEYAHYLVTGKTEAKLTILLLDIKDGYEKGVNESYVAGYFWAYDFFSSTSQNLPAGYKSNELDMIYIDTNPGLSGDNITEAYTTLAHEMQHLMNFVSSIEYRVKNNTVYVMDTWVDEGLSSAAEWVYSGEHPDVRVGWYINNGGQTKDGNVINGKIDVGNNFYMWGNRVTTSDPYPALDDYATVYLFFQWLRLQSNNNIYKGIIKSEKNDNQAVINAFNNITGSSYSAWDVMLKDWFAANNNNSASGRYGYMNDEKLKNIKAHYAPTTTTIDLFPGEGVYSYKTTNPSFSQSGNIKYEYFSGNSTLLTYNANPENTASTASEQGRTTGSKPPASVIISGSGNLNMRLAYSGVSGPFPIGMGDVIKAENANNALKFDISNLKRAIADE